MVFTSVSASSESSWRYALASAVGRSHLATGTPCQDASACETVSQADASALIAVVSDGAGSAPLAEVGSRFACQVVTEELRAVLAGGGGVAALDRDFALGALERLQHALARLARRAGRPVRDFACTLLFAAADERSASFAQIGDGAIVVSTGPRDYGWVFWPQQGACRPMSSVRSAGREFTFTSGDPSTAGPMGLMCGQAGQPCASLGTMARSPSRP